MQEYKRVHLIIQGKVQGVFFRMETRGAAQARQVSGWVRNLPDGSVEAALEGKVEDVDQMIDWCRSGPPLAKVEDVRIREEAYKGEFAGFQILH